MKNILNAMTGIGVSLILLLTACEPNTPPTPPGSSSTAGVKVSNSTEKELEFVVETPKLVLREVKTPSGTFQRIIPPNGNEQIMRSGDEYFSMAEAPVFSIEVALPLREKGAKVEIIPVGEPITQKARLYPVQRPTRAKTGEKEKDVFEFDEKRYRSSKVGIKDVVSFRQIYGGDQNVYRLALNLFDYDPTTETITRYPSYRVRVFFPNVDKCFRYAPPDVGNFQLDPVDKFNLEEKKLQFKHILNYQIYDDLVCYYPGKIRLPGANFVIVTHPDFMAEANDLKAHKISKGMSTIVISTQTISTSKGDGSGNVTDTQVKEYLRDYYNTSFYKPKYLLLLGDAEFIPTHYLTQDNTWDNAKNAGDQFYGQMNNDDLSLPIFGIGRIPIDNAQQAQVVVDKIKAYENSPPSNFNRFYYDMTFAAQFQDNEPDGTANRWFAETSEHIRNYVIIQDRLVERIYKTRTNVTPLKWNDGTNIPSSLKKPGFPWDGDKADIIAAINDGTSLIYHRDHGWWDGWGTPGFKTGDLGSVSVSNNEFPLVFSINCASGIFDNETDSAGYGTNANTVNWGEAFLRKSDGAIGIVGDMRSSSTTANNTMAKGLFDAIFPGYQSYGSAQAKLMLGDMLVHAKGFVSASGASDNAVKQENTIYNLIGDPTIRFRTSRYWLLTFKEKVEQITRTKPWVQAKIELKIPQCLSCPRMDIAPYEQVIAVVQEPKSGRVLGRGMVNAQGEVNIPVKGYTGSVDVTFSGPDVFVAPAGFAIEK